MLYIFVAEHEYKMDVESYLKAGDKLWFEISKP